jgi:hypothetical protein
VGVIVHDTHPTPAPPPLRLDEVGWRALYAALLEIADAQGTHARRATRVLFEAGEVALGELDDWANADTAWAAALEHSPHFGPALLARLELAITRDAPSAAAGVFEAVLRVPEGALERRETSAIVETCLLAWVFRWRDLERAASAADALRRAGDAERLVAPLEALYETPDKQRARLESAVARASTTTPSLERFWEHAPRRKQILRATTPQQLLLQLLMPCCQSAASSLFT